MALTVLPACENVGSTQAPPHRCRGRGHGPQEKTLMSSAESTVPIGLCQCGCGQKTRLADRTSPSLGWVKGEPLKRIHRHQGRQPGTPYTVDTDTGCWVWQRGLNPDGYAMLNRKEYRGVAHRWYYEQLVGPIPGDLQLDHLCRNRRCVNPEHLEAVTQSENVQRGANAKLTPADVLAIRQSTDSAKTLARSYGVCREQIYKIRRGLAWGNI